MSSVTMSSLRLIQLALDWASRLDSGITANTGGLMQTVCELELVVSLVPNLLVHACRLGAAILQTEDAPVRILLDV